MCDTGTPPFKTVKEKHARGPHTLSRDLASVSRMRLMALAGSGCFGRPDGRQHQAGRYVGRHRQEAEADDHLGDRVKLPSNRRTEAESSGRVREKKEVERRMKRERKMREVEKKKVTFV